MADERSRPADSLEASGSAGTETEPSRPEAARPPGRSAREPGAHASPRTATIKLPDASRDPSCVRAHADGPASPPAERAAPHGGFTPVRKTQRLGTVPVWTAAGARNAAGAAGKEARAASQEATPEHDDPPPRSVRRSRPWAEVPDPSGAGIRVIAELEAASRDLDSVPMEPILRFNARGRTPDSLRSPTSRRGKARSAPTDPEDGPTHDAAKARLDLDDDPDFQPRRRAKRRAALSGSFTATTAGYVGAILALIGVGLWIWNAASSSAREAVRPGDNPAPATAAPVTTSAPRVESTANLDSKPPPATTTAATSPSLLPSADPATTFPASPTAPLLGPPRGRPPQKPSKSGAEIVDPWEKPAGR